MRNSIAFQAPSRRITIREAGDPGRPLHSMQGLGALVDAMAEQGVDAVTLFAGTGIVPQAISDHEARISHRQKIALFDNVRRLSNDSAVGLRAGQRQRLSDFGVYGYALLSSATFAEAIDFGIKHIRLAGPVIEKSFRIEGDVAIFEGHGFAELGPLLPMASEFWFSSMQVLISRILERPFEALCLQLPYPAPAAAPHYEDILRCPVNFDAPAMQWRFDARLLELPLPNANPITAQVSSAFCHRMLEAADGVENPLVQAIKEICLNASGGLPRAEQMAHRLNLSSRTLHRRLADAGTTYQGIVDGVRKRLAIEFLERTQLSVGEIAERTGFSDESNFRKAFRKWTNQTTTFYRERRAEKV
ncbi:AraC family transcriptional regulator [Variovorax sp. dw_308]|uniref:AraC family transcriptional regulator n=1 Tax=Variovorax sp. dw_308 TaxID=2721546 RepID=UPI001C480525